ncbi:sigma factor-like helix-turn-helix DNA-binding protein [Vagococcus sp. JNUCC 83]
MRFQWLQDYQELEDQILYLKWNLNKSKLELDRWVYGDLSEIKIEKNSRSSSLENSIEKMTEEIERLEEQKQEMIKLVNSFSGIENEIVKLKYVDNLTLEEIAEKTGYSTSYIRQKHANVRNILKFVDEYEAANNDRQKKISELEYFENNRTKDKQITLF